MLVTQYGRNWRFEAQDREEWQSRALEFARTAVAITARETADDENVGFDDSVLDLDALATA
eukprot:425900-Amphidinium_carterae.3